MNEQPQGAGSKVEVALDELHDGASRLHDLADETRSKLAPSDQALGAGGAAWRGLKSASAFAAYAERETARGESATSAIGQAAGNVGHAAEHYEHTDATNADAVNRATWQ